MEFIEANLEAFKKQLFAAATMPEAQVAVLRRWCILAG